MNPEDAVTSTLPDGGLNLIAELRRYKEWLIDQALVRTQGNRAQAARLLGLKRTTLVMMLRESRRSQPLEKCSGGSGVAVGLALHSH
jgi:DNA-binding NtrC family response regulator